MTYIPKFVPGITIEEAKAEIKDWHWRQYAYSCFIDRNRICDLEFTIAQLEKEAAA